MEIIRGKVIKGKGLGKQLGFPTINIHYDGELSGVFAGTVLIKGRSYPAAINVGSRPTVDDEKNLCEAFLVNLSAEELPIINEIQVGDELEIQFKQKIRDTIKFVNVDELKAQITKDVEFVKNCYNVRDNSLRDK